MLLRARVGLGVLSRQMDPLSDVCIFFPDESSWAEKSFDKIQHLFIVEMLQTMGTEGAYLNKAKAIYDKPTANVFNYEKLNAFLLRSGSRVYTFTTIIQHSFGSPSYSHQRRKIKKRNPDQKRRSKYLIVDGSPPGSPIPGILQASTLESVAIFFSDA